jgi:hypothetical protein
VHAGVGAEIKQHGGCFFAQGVIKAQHYIPGSLSQSPSATAEDASPSALSQSISPRRSDDGRYSRLDAADTEHVLLQSPLMWHPARQVRDDPAGAGSEENSEAPSESAKDPERVPVSSVLKTLARVHLETGGASSSVALPSRATARCNGASAPKRSRSGLSTCLPSLVELPMEEDAGISLSNGSTPSFGSPFGAHMHGSKSVSLPGICSRSSLTADYGASGCDAGSNFSLSSPGAVHGNLGVTGAPATAEDRAATAGTGITEALSHASRSAPMLSLVRAALCKAKFGQGLKHLSAGGSHSQCLQATASQEEDSLNTKEETNRKRHGSQLLMQALEAAEADSRVKWLQLVAERGLTPGCEGFSKRMSSALLSISLPS